MIRRLLLSASLALLLLVSAAVVAPVARVQAWNPFGTVCSDNPQTTKDSPVCSRAPDSKNDPLSGNAGLLAKITNLVAVVGGVAAVIMIIVAGFTYVTSGGDSAKVTNAKDTILFSLIGLVVIFMARAIVIFVINKLN